ncbi:MAG: phytanoyl-CoA dioxygenase family protein [Pseudomonadota bacterium]
MAQLTNPQLSDYEVNGYLCPLAGIDANAAEKARQDVLSFGATSGINLARDFRGKSFLRLMSLSRIAHSSAILDAVESLIGPNILCYYGSLFMKSPNDAAGSVPWHQDGGYFSQDSDGLATAWVALSDSTVENGAMRVIPGSHKERRLHGEVDGAGETLFYDTKEQLLGDVDESQAIHLLLKQGQVSFHHPDIVHASSPNKTGSWRIGMALRYVTPHYNLIDYTMGARSTALLMRGVNDGDVFETVAAPRFDEDPKMLDVIARDAEQDEKLVVQHVDSLETA